MVPSIDSRLCSTKGEKVDWYQIFGDLGFTLFHSFQKRIDMQKIDLTGLGL
jgi:hypothetical protein